MRTSVSARKNPVSGDSTIADVVLMTPAHTTATPPALATPAPIRPPISACELDDGIPPHQVIRFQEIAPIKAPKMTRASTTSAETMPTPTVCATWAPKNRNAMKLKNAAHITAYCGRSTRVDTMVAIELAASCRPFRKSNANATMIRATRTGRLMIASTAMNPVRADR